MAVDKTLEIAYDLSSINQEQVNKLIQANDDIIKKANSQKKQKAQPQSLKSLQDRLGDKKSTFKTLFSFGSNPVGFLSSSLTKGIPGLGAAIAATGVIVTLLKTFDDREKKFTDELNTKINADRNNEEIARIQAGLSQDIFTPTPGIYDPRDTYNSLSEFNTNQRRVETEYNIRNTQGVE